MPTFRLFAHLALLAATLTASAVNSPAFGQSAPANGEQIFKQRCAACHTATAGQAGKIAPNLSGVVGRKAASTAFAYSAALKASNLTWSRANLDRFLTAPGRMVPGTRMVIAVTDSSQRSALIQYLASAR